MHEVCPRSSARRRLESWTASEPACDGGDLLGIHNQQGGLDAFQASHKGPEMASLSGSPVVAMR